jgi:hypothetical protein
LLIGAAATVGALERLVTRGVDAVPGNWQSDRCLDATLEGLGPPVEGSAELCAATGGVRGSLDLVHLQPMAGYVAWLAYFPNPAACGSFAGLVQSGDTSERLCTFADLDTRETSASLQPIGAGHASAGGTMMLDGVAGETVLARHAQAWLLLEHLPSGWPGIPLAVAAGYGDPNAFEARALFRVP